MDIISIPDPSIFGTEYGTKGRYNNSNYEIGVTDGVFEAPSDWIIFVNYKFTDGFSFVEVVSTVVEYTSDDYKNHAPKAKFDWSPSTTYAAFREDAA